MRSYDIGFYLVAVGLAGAFWGWEAATFTFFAIPSIEIGAARATIAIMQKMKENTKAEDDSFDPNFF